MERPVYFGPESPYPADTLVALVMALADDPDAVADSLEIDLEPGEVLTVTESLHWVADAVTTAGRLQDAVGRSLRSEGWEIAGRAAKERKLAEFTAAWLKITGLGGES